MNRVRLAAEGGQKSARRQEKSAWRRGSGPRSKMGMVHLMTVCELDLGSIKRDCATNIATDA
jgi:hypothetical protein